MSTKELFYNAFFDHAAIQTGASSVLMYIVHLFISAEGVKLWTGIAALIFAAFTGLMGALRMRELYLYQRALRKREEEENKKLGI